MQAAQVTDGTIAGTKHEVEGVAEQDLGANFLQPLWRHRLDRAVGAAGHEHRSFYLTARRVQPAAAGGTVRRQNFKTHTCLSWRLASSFRSRNMASP